MHPGRKRLPTGALVMHAAEPQVALNRCWWNGRHAALRTQCLMAWGFESLTADHIRIFGGAHMARSICSTPGCPVLVYPSGRCGECVAKARARRGNPRRVYDKEWKRVRAAYLRAHPYCECTECGVLPMPLKPTATEVDHMDGLGPLGPRGHDWTNLRSMTKAHHSRETARHQPGGWNDRG